MRTRSAFVLLLSLATSPALAQLLDDTPPTVTITAPANGATVSGTITISANASDNIAVAGVQFRYNGGNNIGAEDSVPPYAVSADTTTVPNGTYTLTAVARDFAGNQATSAPVVITVANNAPPPPPPPAGRFEENDPSVSYSAGWSQSNPGWFAWSGGSAVESGVPNAQATFTFTGTSVTWIGYRSGRSGIARVFLDGAFVKDVDLFGRMDEAHIPVFTARNLADTTHTLSIQVTGMQNSEAVSNIVLIDAFDVPAPVVSHLQDSDSDVAYSAGWGPADGTIAWSGGTASASSTAGAQATFTFNGTSVGVSGAQAPNTGIANIYVDGALAAQVDTYSAVNRIQGVIYTSPPLADGQHTVTVEVTGQKNASSGGAMVVVDAFDVTHLGTRVEETDPAVTYTGSWIQGNLNRTWSLGTAAESGTAGAQATFSFNGTSVSWIGCRKMTTGIANVYVDGMFVAQLDTYRATEGLQDTVYTASGLAPGNHTITIEATGQKNPASQGTWVVVDAFDVR